MGRLKSGRMQNEDWIKLSEAMGVLSEAPVYIDDTPVLTITDLRAKCRKAAMKLGEIGLVVMNNGLYWQPVADVRFFGRPSECQRCDRHHQTW